MGGHVDFGVLAVQHAATSDGKLNALAIFSNERDSVQTEVPTMAEMGMPFVPFYSPMVLAAPKDVPDYVVKKLETAVKQATETDEFKKLSKNAGLAVRYRSSQEVKKLKEQLWKEWQPTIELIKTKPGS
jgi:tripartite-type tricarboxylate transporter receptor subunit TctC